MRRRPDEDDEDDEDSKARTTMRTRDEPAAVPRQVAGTAAVPQRAPQVRRPMTSDP